MQIIYEPQGRAAEYTPLALNLYNGCTHKCRYCYAPAVLRIPREKYFMDPNPKKDVIAKVRKDADKLASENDMREILISFIGDSYQPAEKDLGLTRQVIEILINYNLSFSILTKGGKLAMRDFDMLQDYPRCRFGVTMTLCKTKSLAKWEPDVDGVLDRLTALQVAHDLGIRTWLSLEPVIYPNEALDIIEATLFIVDHYKVGRINYIPEFESVDWVSFRDAAVKIFNEWEADYYIKKSLQENGGRIT